MSIKEATVASKLVKWTRSARKELKNNQRNSSYEEAQRTDLKGVEESSQKTVLESRETVRRFRRRTEKATDKSYHKHDSPSKKILNYNWCFSQFHQEHSAIIRCIPRLRS